MSRSISAAGISLIISFEGVRLTAYKAVPTETYYTIGYGHYGPDVARGMTITQAQAEALLKNDLKKFEAKVNKYNEIYDWTQNEFDALTSFAYNVGSIDQLTNNGKRTKMEISQHITAYNKSGGVTLKGLSKRRTAEKALFDKDGLQVSLKAGTIYPTIRRGMANEYVRKAQQALNDKNIRGGSLDPDGIYGYNTYLSVIELQALYNLKKDGVIGPQTWAVLLP